MVTFSKPPASGKPGDYRNTLNVTLSDNDPGAFPQRANLPAKEPIFQKRWDALDIYGKSMRREAPMGNFIVHDGPPYSNGDAHLGHALNKVAKDITMRFRTMQGYRCPFIPGWDNHGMPIENAVSRKFREEKKNVSRVELRQACREYAARWVDTQREQFKRLGIRGQWDDPYLTMSKDFEAKIVEVFGELALKGFIYRGLKPVFWCATCETALADAEVEYEEHTSNSIYVRFPLHHDPMGVFEGVSENVEGHAYAVIWTTTPWTIPANLAIAAHPDAEYAVVRANRAASENVEAETSYYLVAVPLVDSVMKAASVSEYETLKTLNGAGLQGLVFRHPLFHRTSPIVLADYVTMDAGTGLVHTAPGHGKEDFETGLKYGLEVLTPVDAAGRYTVQAGEYGDTKFEGLRVTTWGDKKGQDAEANPVILNALREAGNLLNATKFEHSYPHCWRCHSPLIFRATVQWFMKIDHETDGQSLRQRALQAIDEVDWVPASSINRIKSMVANRPDWCVSRQRTWGVGIPAFYCDHCGEHVLTKESIQSVVDMTAREGSDVWYSRPASEILPSGFACPHCGSGVEKLRKETDVLDVWFDSGSTNRAVLENTSHWPNLQWPADLYLEGGDQHRGWFNSSLMIAVATRGSAPFKQVVTNGWSLDENGQAMHKSLGNVINPLVVCEQYGADVLRLWAASQNFMEDTRCGENLLKQVSEDYRRIRNTFRFLLNNLYDFDAGSNTVPDNSLNELDKWALEQLNQTLVTATQFYATYEFQRVYQVVRHFCTVDLSNFYLDVLKDRLYTSAPNSEERRSTQTVLYRLAAILARLLAPILPHTMEEVWDHLDFPGKRESVHLESFPVGRAPNVALLSRWSVILAVRDKVNKTLEEGRVRRLISGSGEAQITVSAGGAAFQALLSQSRELEILFGVSEVILKNNGVSREADIQLGRASGDKCARCRRIKRNIGLLRDYADLCAECAEVVSARE